MNTFTQKTFCLLALSVWPLLIFAGFHCQTSAGYASGYDYCKANFPGRHCIPVLNASNIALALDGDDGQNYKNFIPNTVCAFLPKTPYEPVIIVYKKTNDPKNPFIQIYRNNDVAPPGITCTDSGCKKWGY